MRKPKLEINAASHNHQKPVPPRAKRTADHAVIDEELQFAKPVAPASIALSARTIDADVRDVEPAPVPAKPLELGPGVKAAPKGKAKPTPRKTVDSDHTPPAEPAGAPPAPATAAGKAKNVKATTAPASSSAPKTSAGPAPSLASKAAANPASDDESGEHEAADQAASAPRRKTTAAQRFNAMRPMHVVEAALFSAGKPISLDDIVQQTGLPPESVKRAVLELQKAYAERDSVIEVGKAGAKWAMQVRTQAAEPAAKFSPPEIAPKLLKTLALIAYHQPMKQSELVDMIGTKVYDHIPELVERGLVRAREEGVTKILATTAAFPEYFGLDAATPEEIRAVMGKLVGIEAPPKAKDDVMEEAAIQEQKSE